MQRSKLIVVEGIPGSGKTTLAGFVGRWLEERAIPARLYLEGNLDHPADFEAVAYFPRAEYAAFVARHPRYQVSLVHAVQIVGDECFLGYGTLIQEAGLPESMRAALEAREVYELPVATHTRLMRERWRAFVAGAREEEVTYVFECCLLQNPLTVALLRHNLPAEAARQYVETLLEEIAPLDPVVIYLRPQDVHATLTRVAAERPPEWRAYVGAYTDRSAWGQATGASGFEGFIRALEIRQRVELDILHHAPVTRLIVDTSAADWDAIRRQVGDFLTARLTDNRV